MASFDLNEFLAQQQNEGNLDSGGEFLVSPSDAARKLARFALPDPYSWVLKVLQAVTTWRAPALQIKQTKECTSFYFSPAQDEDYPSREQLFKTLLSMDIGGSKPIQRLSIALRSLVEQTGLSFVLGVRLSASEHYSVYAGHDVGQLKEKTRVSWAEIPLKGLRLTVSHQKLGEHLSGRYAPQFMLRDRRDIEIAQEVERTAFCMPMPVTLDGRRLDKIWSVPGLGFSATHRPLLISGAKPQPPEFRALPRRLSKQRVSLFQASISAARNIESEESFSSWFVLRGIDLQSLSTMGSDLRIFKEGPHTLLAEPAHRVCWICDGVLVSDQEFHSSALCWVAQLILFVNGDGLQTDLTGLSLVDSDEKTARLERACKDTSRQLKLELSQLDLYTEEQAHANRQTLREECREEFVHRLPSSLGFFRRIAAAGATGYYEWRQQSRIEIWKKMLWYDLNLLQEVLEQTV